MRHGQASLRFGDVRAQLFGFSPAQAAITLGIPAGTVRVRLHRARQRLAEAVDGEVAS